ncbi:MAG TPA: efflux RND transporter permease subunit [Galbitalea sp.]
MTNNELPIAAIRRLPARWLRILLPLLVIAVWAFVGSQGGPTFGTISAVTNNDQSSYLPASAESTEVQKAQIGFFGSDTIPAIVLYVRSAGLTPQDRAAVTERLASIGRLSGVDSVSAAVPSADGKALEVFVPVKSSADGGTVVAALRSAVSKDLPAGLVVHVTGPAALGADFGAGFSGIDGILLLVALLAVFVILLVVYRSLLLPVLVLATSAFALTGSILVVYLLAKAGWVTVTGESRGILAILALGAATDYSMLLVSRYREALHGNRTSWEAMRVALRAAVAPIAASGATVILGVLCLLLSGLNSNRGLGPVAAVAIAFSLLSALTALPALLVLCGRASFWPFRPRFDESATRDAAVAPTSRLWRAAGRLISTRPRWTWIISVVILAACGLGVLQLQANGVPQTDLLLTQSDSVTGQKALAQHYDAGSGSPVEIVTPKGSADRVLPLTKATSGISGATVYTGTQTGPVPNTTPLVRHGEVLIEAILTHQADSDVAQQVVVSLRDQLKKVEPAAKVGGVSALDYDTNATAISDLKLIIPVVLVVILIVLMLLLRAIVAPLVLMGTVVLSYVAALGVSALVFNHLFHFPGADPSVPLFGFVFLVALGVDYNIFLMTRVREESKLRGTRPGVVRALGATGGVITSAGIVLAATFSALGVVPILFLVQIAFIVAFGVLLDTTLVRSLLVPALSYDLGSRIWWPSKLAAETRD